MPSSRTDRVHTGGRMIVARSATQRLAEDYTSSAADYATLWGPTILPMALPLLDRLPLDDCRRVLDVGAGVGALMEHLHARLPDAFICGADRSEGMLRVAAARHRHGLAVMDAQALALREAAFDVVTMAFMLFHLPDPSAGLREAARALRRGGAVGLVTWADEQGLPGQQIWSEELDRAGAEPEARDDSVRQFGLLDEPDKVHRLLAAAGLTSSEIWVRRFERAWEAGPLLRLQQRCGMPGRRLKSLPPGERARCVARARERIEAMRPGELTWACAVLYAVAAKGPA